MGCVKGRVSENTNREIRDKAKEMNLREHQQNVLKKIQVTLCKCKKTTMDEDSEDVNLPSKNQDLRLKVVRCKPRAKRKICH